MEKRSASPPAATIAANLGLFIHLGGWRPMELERLKNGAGRWMRRIDAAMEDWRNDPAASGASIVPIVLLYRCRGLRRFGDGSDSAFDSPETIESTKGMGLRTAAPIVIELGEIAGAQIEKLLRGSGKVLEEAREALRLVQLKAAADGTDTVFVPVVATCIAPQHALEEEPKTGDDGACGVAARRLTIRYFRASRAKADGSRKRITIV